MKHVYTLFARYNEYTNQNGQIFLIVVLIMVIGATVGLAVASRSVTNLKTTNEEENSQRAFAAAEAGVEKALRLKPAPGTYFSGEQIGTPGTKIASVTVDPAQNGSDYLIDNGMSVDANDGVDVWLSNDGTVTGTLSNIDLAIFWGEDGKLDSDCTKNPAIEIIAFSGTSPTESTRDAYDPCNTRGNNFSAPDSTTSTTSVNGSNGVTKNFRYYSIVRLPQNTIIVRLIPLYKGTAIGVKGITKGGRLTDTATLPKQGTIITSTGTSGNTTRKIEYIQSYPKVPNELFQYILFQPN